MIIYSIVLFAIGAALGYALRCLIGFKERKQDETDEAPPKKETLTFYDIELIENAKVEIDKLSEKGNLQEGREVHFSKYTPLPKGETMKGKDDEQRED